MANELRVRTNFAGGLVEDNPLSSSATTLTSAGLASVPAVGSTQHVVLIIDPDAVGGNPEIVYVTAHTALATTATIVRAQEGTAARQHLRDTPWLHGPTTKDFDASGGGSGLIGFTSYNPAVAAYVGASTGSSGTDIDATNLKVDFTAPPSGKVLVRLTARISTNPVVEQHWCLREASADVAGTAGIVHYNASAYDGGRRSHACSVSGLTPGAAKTYKWGHFRNSGVTAETGMGGAAGPAVMEVWAVNL